MSGEKWTPGPWMADGPDYFCDYNILPGNGESAAIGAVVSNCRPKAEVRANARLIAAAPDLAEAVEAAMLFIADQYRDAAREPQGEWLAPEAMPIYAKLSDALAKARGQS